MLAGTFYEIIFFSLDSRHDLGLCAHNYCLPHKASNALTLDVVSLYSSIIQDLGLCALIY